MKRIDKLWWTMVIRMTKSDQLEEKSDYYSQVSIAYDREFKKRKEKNKEIFYEDGN